jgi:hypothetical protein
MSPHVTIEIAELQNKTVNQLVQRYDPSGVSQISTRIRPRSGLMTKPGTAYRARYVYRIPPNPTEIQHGEMCNPFGVGAVVLRANPGCAARPRAMLLNPFGVGATVLRSNPNGVRHLGNPDAVNISHFRGQSDSARTNTRRPENFGI